MQTKESETIYLSKRGMKDLKKQISKLERQLSSAHQELREMERADSREERFERIEKLSNIESLESELQEKKYQFENSELLPRRRDTLKVALGSVVDLLDSKGRLVRYTIVNSIEADPSDGRISVNSPLGRHLLGRGVNDDTTYNVGMYANKWKLVKIS